VRGVAMCQPGRFGTVRSPIARPMARAVCGASGMVTTLPPVRVMTRIRCPALEPQALDVGTGGFRNPAREGQ